MLLFGIMEGINIVLMLLVSYVGYLCTKIDPIDTNIMFERDLK